MNFESDLGRLMMPLYQGETQNKSAIIDGKIQYGGESGEKVGMWDRSSWSKQEAAGWKMSREETQEEVTEVRASQHVWKAEMES